MPLLHLAFMACSRVIFTLLLSFVPGVNVIRRRTDDWWKGNALKKAVAVYYKGLSQHVLRMSKTTGGKKTTMDVNRARLKPGPS